MAGQRIWAVDVARSLALLAMASYHLVYDMQMFGLLPPGTAVTGFFRIYARLIAGSFLFLAGLGLWLGHGGGIRWHGFWRRWLRIVAAAAVVTLATRMAMPDWFVFFGILHCIAVSSLLGLAFLRLPWPATAMLGAAVIAAAWILPPLLQWNHPALIWIGLHDVPVMSVDLEPLIPWFGPFLLGLATGRALRPLWPRLAALRGPGALAWPGRHSLALYLLHQPVLLALVWLWAQLG